MCACLELSQQFKGNVSGEHVSEHEGHHLQNSGKSEEKILRSLFERLKKKNWKTLEKIVSDEDSRVLVKNIKSFSVLA